MEPAKASGELATATFVLEMYDDDQSVPLPSVALKSRNRDTITLVGDPAVAHMVRQRLPELQRIAEEHFRNALEDDTLSVDLVIKPGSVEVIAVVTAVGAAISNYNLLVGGISEAVENTRRAYMFVVSGIRELSEWRGRMSMRAEWQPGSALTETSRQRAVGAGVGARTANPRDVEVAEPGSPLSIGSNALLLLLSAFEAVLLVALMVVVLIRT